jgi:hypothetical protein
LIHNFFFRFHGGAHRGAVRGTVRFSVETIE